jgi:hypothetical protein
MNKKSAILRLAGLTMALSLMGVVFTATAFAGATVVTTNVQIPYQDSVFVPCAMDGAGEWVDLSGTLHVLFHTTLNNNGGFHTKTHSQPQGVSGTGRTSGDKYQGTGVTQDNFNGNVGSQYTFVNNFRVIGQGPGNNFLVHQLMHVTVNANGEVTASVDNSSVECK